MDKAVSIVIPNYNGEKLIQECLNSIKKQTFKDYEIIVVDDASIDHSLEILKKEPVRVIQNDTNRGFAASVNRGIKASNSDYVLLLNNDVVLTESFLEKQVEAIKKSPLIFSVSPKMVRYYERDLLDDTGDEYTVFGWVYKRGDGDNINSYDHFDTVFSACAGAGLYSSFLLKQTGLLDELHYAYLEDVDLGWRARILGYENVYTPEAVCFHIGSATLAEGKRYSAQKVELSARNNVYIIYKNMPAWQIILNAPTLLLGFAIKWVYFLKQGYGSEYLSGLAEGIKTRKKLKKVVYKNKHLKNYFNIQKRMAVSSVKYCLYKTGKLALKGIEKIMLLGENPAKALQ